MKYLDPKRVTDSNRTIVTPRGKQRQDGYGSKIPTNLMLQLDKKRWHRVYMVQWSNMGSAYIVDKGECLYLGSYWPD